MSTGRRVDPQDRLEAYLATLRPPSLKALLKRRAAHWQLYAAVTGSAVAMATNPSVSIAGAGITAARMPNFLAARRHPGHGLPGRAMAIGQVSPSNAPAIAAGGIVPLYGTASVIQPGEWVSIFGTNLASGTAVWQGDFPTSLGGTSVEINGKLAYLSSVSPGQINLQAPDDGTAGPVSVVVTTGAGTATSRVTLGPFSPSLLLLDGMHVTAIILRRDGSGAYGNGAFDILGPTGTCFGYYTMAAKAGDVVELFGVGFGPTTPTVLAGTTFSGSAPINGALSLRINNILVEPSFVGLSGPGLYQINLVIPPGLGEGDLSIRAGIGGMQTQAGLLLSLQGASPMGSACVLAGDGGDGGISYGDGGDGGLGFGDGGNGGAGDGGMGDGGVVSGGGGDGGDGGDGDGDGGGGDGGGDGGC